MNDANRARARNLVLPGNFEEASTLAMMKVLGIRGRLGPRHRGRYVATPRFARGRWLPDRATSLAAILPRISYIRLWLGWTNSPRS
jgi:hypothetical protein